MLLNSVVSVTFGTSRLHSGTKTGRSKRRVVEDSSASEGAQGSGGFIYLTPTQTYHRTEFEVPPLDLTRHTAKKGKPKMSNTEPLDIFTASAAPGMVRFP